MSERYDCIVLTGANRGIGLEFARHFAPVTDRLVACCRDPESAEDLNRLAAEHDSIELRRLDVSSPDDIEALSRAVGDSPVDVLINNAGISGPSQRGLPVDKEAWHEVFDVDTMAPLKIAEAFLDRVAASERRVIANLTSKMGSIADNGSGGAYVYRSAKAALNAAMKSLAEDTRDRGITVLLLHPGWVKTAMGGPNALIDTETSVSGMKRIIDGATDELTGRFLNYDGSEIPW